MALQWNELDDRAVKTAKALAADAVEHAGSGHPGTAISLAGAAYLIFQRHLRFDPTDPSWLGRDRFVLSAGHSSLTQYVQLYLAGLGVTLEDLQTFRTFGSKLPGHPEYGHTDGIEITTGPLGSGLASAVGMAMAARRAHGILDKETPMGQSPFDHNVYVIAGDGCLQEGIAAEASSLAGTQELGNLVVLYDDNHISIEDDTCIAFTEDVCARYEALGWHVAKVDWSTAGPDGQYFEDLEALDQAITAAKAQTGKPSLIALRTVIGWPAPTKANTGGIHGAKLGTEELAGLKKNLGLDPQATFAPDIEAVTHAQANAAHRGTQLRTQWDKEFETWKSAHATESKLLDRLLAKELPANWKKALPQFPAGQDIATRAASGKVLTALADVLPELWGGSADLAGSNNTTMAGQPSFIPAHRSSKAFSGDIYGRTIHFGVREHAMGAIMNGIALEGLTKPYGGTFFVFSDYMRGAVRLSALMDIPVTYVWTHDSIGVGEDGPTHQPVEHLTAYRAIPNLDIVRPADGAETAAAWKAIIENGRPTGLILSRQNLPNPARGAGSELADACGTARGGYVLAESQGKLDVILMATGSEVPLALEAREMLATEGIGARVVSMPCLEWFQAQDQDYRDSVLPREVRARVSVEAGLATPWWPYLGEAGKAIAMDGFGAPGAAQTLYEHFGITAEAVANAAKESLATVK